MIHPVPQARLWPMLTYYQTRLPKVSRERSVTHLLLISASASIGVLSFFAIENDGTCIQLRLIRPQRLCILFSQKRAFVVHPSNLPLEVT